MTSLNKENLVVTTILRGSLSVEEFEILLSFTSIRSEDVIEALQSFSVDGYTKPTSYKLAGISQQQFDRNFKKIDNAFRKVETLWELKSDKSQH